MPKLQILHVPALTMLSYRFVTLKQTIIQRCLWNAGRYFVFIVFDDCFPPNIAQYAFATDNTHNVKFYSCV